MTPNMAGGVGTFQGSGGLRGSNYLKVHGTYSPVITVLIAQLRIPLKGLIGVIPIISRVISPVIIG